MYVDPKRNQQAGNLAWILPYCKPDLPRVAGAVERERPVDVVAAGAVRVADDGDVGARVLVQRAREAVQDRTEVGLDVRASRVERDVARDFQLQCAEVNLQP